MQVERHSALTRDARNPNLRHQLVFERITSGLERHESSRRRARRVLLRSSSSGAPARSGLLHPPGAPAVDVTQSSVVGRPLGWRAVARRGKGPVDDRGDLVLAQTRVPDPEQTGADGHVARNCALRATVIAIQRSLSESPISGSPGAASLTTALLGPMSRS